MVIFRTLVLAAIVGAFLGIVVATLSAEALISADLCGMTADTLTSRPCLDTVSTTVGLVIRTQGMGAAIGAVLGMIGAIFWLRRKPKTPARPAGTPAA